MLYAFDSLTKELYKTFYLLACEAFNPLIDEFEVGFDSNSKWLF